MGRRLRKIREALRRAVGKSGRRRAQLGNAHFSSLLKERIVEVNPKQHKAMKKPRPRTIVSVIGKTTATTRKLLVLEDRRKPDRRKP